MFCNKCGKQLPDNAVFCNKCGTKLYKGAANEQPDSLAETKYQAVAAATAEAENPLMFEITNSKTDVTKESLENNVSSSVTPYSAAVSQFEETVSQTIVEPVREVTEQIQSPVEPIKESIIQSQESQENFIRYVDNYIKTNTGFNSAFELLNSKPKANFAWLSYGISAAVALVLSVISILNGNGIWVIPFLLALSVLPGYLAAVISGGVVSKLKLISKYTLKLKGQADSEELKTFLDSHLSYLKPYFGEWGDVETTGFGIKGSIQAAAVNAAANASHESNIGSYFGADQKILIQVGVRPDLNGDPGYTICAFSAGGERIGSYFIASHKCIIKTAPILQAALKYYFMWKNGDAFNTSNGTYIEQGSSFVQAAVQASEKNYHTAPAQNFYISAEKSCNSARKNTFLKRFFVSAGIFAVVAVIFIIFVIKAPEFGLPAAKETAKTTAAGNFDASSDVGELSVIINGESYDIQNTIKLDLIKTALSDSDVENIGKLVNLTNLTLNLYQINDITPLQNLTNLTSLYLDFDNKSLDITPLSNLTNLTELWLYCDNNSVDITPLANLTNLTSLILDSNNINDITLLVNLTNLTSLDLSDNNISDISPLANLTNITSLSLAFNNISDITPLVNLTKLTSLDLSSNYFSNISPLGSLTILTSLSLANNKISDLTPYAKLLASLNNLTSLNLNYNIISDLTPLTILTGLTSLSLETNNISDITPLSNLTNLTSLSLDFNEISDIASLTSLNNLTSLSLLFTDINDITPLAKLTNLQKLSCNNISDQDLLWLESKLPNCNISKFRQF